MILVAPLPGRPPTIPTYLGILVAIVATSLQAAPDESRWQRTLTEIRETFPAVPQLTTRQLAGALERGQPVLLLDARSAAEFRVSHLAGAVHAESTPAALNAIRADRQDATIVVYCSVGYRSSHLVSRLQAQGVGNVFNLEGSLFQWANEDRPLVRGDEPASRVHPYNDDWGELLNETARAE